MAERILLFLQTSPRGDAFPPLARGPLTLPGAGAEFEGRAMLHYKANIDVRLLGASRETSFAVRVEEGTDVFPDGLNGAEQDAVQWLRSQPNCTGERVLQQFRAPEPKPEPEPPTAVDELAAALGAHGHEDRARVKALLGRAVQELGAGQRSPGERPGTALAASPGEVPALFAGRPYQA